MGQQLEIHQQVLYRNIDLILWNEWDPYGIHCFVGARDEYYRYIFPLLTILVEGANIQRIANYLYRVENSMMQLNADKERCLRVAQLIYDSNCRLLTSNQTHTASSEWFF